MNRRVSYRPGATALCPGQNSSARAVALAVYPQPEELFGRLLTSVTIFAAVFACILV